MSLYSTRTKILSYSMRRHRDVFLKQGWLETGCLTCFGLVTNLLRKSWSSHLFSESLMLLKNNGPVISGLENCLAWRKSLPHFVIQSTFSEIKIISSHFSLFQPDGLSFSEYDWFIIALYFALCRHWHEIGVTYDNNAELDSLENHLFRKWHSISELKWVSSEYTAVSFNVIVWPKGRLQHHDSFKWPVFQPFFFSFQYRLHAAKMRDFPVLRRSWRIMLSFFALLKSEISSSEMKAGSFLRPRTWSSWQSGKKHAALLLGG